MRDDGFCYICRQYGHDEMQHARIPLDASWIGNLVDALRANAEEFQAHRIDTNAHDTRAASVWCAINAAGLASEITDILTDRD